MPVIGHESRGSACFPKCRGSSMMSMPSVVTSESERPSLRPGKGNGEEESPAQRRPKSACRHRMSGDRGSFRTTGEIGKPYCGLRAPAFPPDIHPRHRESRASSSRRNCGSLSCPLSMPPGLPAGHCRRTGFSGGPASFPFGGLRSKASPGAKIALLAFFGLTTGFVASTKAADLDAETVERCPDQADIWRT